MFFPLLIILLTLGIAHAECSDLPPTVNESITLCAKTYDVSDSVSITADHVIVDCGTAILRNNRKGRGIVAENRRSITIQNCNLVTFATGLYFRNVSRAIVTKNNFVKNDISIMMEDSHENWIAGNTDKSLQMPMVIMRGKFNTIQFDNKNIDGSLCSENVCNSQGTLNPCVSFDGYCSSVCSPQSDEDCVPPPVPVGQATSEIKTFDDGASRRYATAVAQVNTLEEGIRKQLTPPPDLSAPQRKTSILPMILAAVVIVGLSVLVIIKNERGVNENVPARSPLAGSVGSSPVRKGGPGTGDRPLSQTLQSKLRP